MTRRKTAAWLTAATATGALLGTVGTYLYRSNPEPGQRCDSYRAQLAHDQAVHEATRARLLDNNDDVALQKEDTNWANYLLTREALPNC